MFSKRVLLPEGVQDLLVEDCIYRRHIENSLVESFKRRGYMEVCSPTLEYYDLFVHDSFRIDREKLFKLIDGDGSILVLCPDGTIPISRIVSTKMKDFVYPLRLCYIKDVFRFDEEQAGKKREFRQAGVELLGIHSYLADAEVIITAVESLKELGLMDFQIEIGQVKFLRRILERLDLHQDEKQEIIGCIENKNIMKLSNMLHILEIPNNFQLVLKELPRLYGNPREVIEKLKDFSLDERLKTAVEELERVCHRVWQVGLEEHISVDLGMMDPLGYYTGIIFKGFTKHLGSVICRGGRYDTLFSRFGMDCPAAGFAFMINKITKALKIQNHLKIKKKKHYLIVDPFGRYQQVKEIVEKIRQEGHIVEFSLLQDKKAIFEYGKRRNIDSIFQINKDGSIVEFRP